MNLLKKGAPDPVSRSKTPTPMGTTERDNLDAPLLSFAFYLEVGKRTVFPVYVT